MQFHRLWLFLATFVLLSIGAGQAVASESDGRVQGGNFQQLGDWEVHYSAFPSTFLQPEVARANQLQRSNSRGILNISVLDSRQEHKPGVRVAISGYALNSLGQRRELSFKRVIDEPAIYYLAEVPHEREDTLRFFITLQQGNTTQTLRFNHTFYRL